MRVQNKEVRPPEHFTADQQKINICATFIPQIIGFMYVCTYSVNLHFPSLNVVIWIL